MPAVVVDESILCEHHPRAQTYSSKTIQSIFAGKMVEYCAVRFANHRMMRRGPSGTNRPTLSVATGILQVGRRDMRTRLKDRHDLGPILPSTAFPWSVKGYI